MSDDAATRKTNAMFHFRRSQELMDEAERLLADPHLHPGEVADRATLAMAHMKLGAHVAKGKWWTE